MFVPDPLRRMLLTLAVGLTLAGVGAAPAAAGDYTVWSCRGPDGAPVSTAAWQPGLTAVGGVPIGSRGDSCATGGALSASLDARTGGNNRPYDTSGYRLVIPTGSPMTGYRVWLSADTVQATTGAYGAGLSVGTDTAPIGVIGITKGCTGGAAACTFGTGADPLGAANLVVGSGLSRGTTLVVRCDPTQGTAGQSCLPATPGDPVGTVALYRSQLTFDDGAAPSLDPPEGDLLDPAGVRGSAEVHADAADAEGGVQRTELLVDGAVAQVRSGRGSCAEPFTVAQPCPRELRASFVLDTDALTPGTHQVVVRALDASGAATDSAPAPVLVLPPPAVPPVATAPVPDPVAPALVPAPAGPRSGTIRLQDGQVRSGRRVAFVRGAVATDDGRPAGRVRLEIAQRSLGEPDEAFRKVTYLTTDADGSFTLRTSPTSRELRLTPRDRAVRADAVRVVVFARQQLRLAAVRRPVVGRQRLTLRGTLGGAGTAARDRTVIVEAIVRGTWRPVGTTRTRAGGKVRWAYRFTRTRQAATYRFRLRVPKVSGLPWATVTSRAVSVRVRP